MTTPTPTHPLRLDHGLGLACWGTHVAFMFLEKYSRIGVLCLENAAPQRLHKAVIKTLAKGQQTLSSKSSFRVVYILVTLMQTTGLSYFIECKIPLKSEMFIRH